MFTTTIVWTVYDGTAKTRPHSMKKTYFDLSEKQREKLDADFMLKRHGANCIENQAFSLKVRERYNEKKDLYSFDAWFWESAWLNNCEDNEEYPLQVGDMWAPWPVVIEAVDTPAETATPKKPSTGDTAPELRKAMQEYTAVPALLDALEQFRAMREKAKRPLTSRALQLICTELDKLAGGIDAVKVAILEQSIVNSWRGVFALKGGVARRGTGQHGNTKPDGSSRDYGQSDFGALSN